MAFSVELCQQHIRGDFRTLYVVTIIKNFSHLIIIMLSSQKPQQQPKKQQIEAEEQQNKEALHAYEQEFNRGSSQNTLFIKAGIMDPNNKTLDEQSKGEQYAMKHDDVLIRPRPEPAAKSSLKIKNMDIYMSKMKTKGSKPNKLEVKAGEHDPVEESVGVDFDMLTLENIQHKTPHQFAESDSNQIAIYDLPIKINDQQIKQLCQPFGDIQSVQTRAIYKELKARIIGYVSYVKQEHALKAKQELEKQGKTVKFGRVLGYNQPIKDEINKFQVRVPEDFFLKRIIDRLAKLVASEGYIVEHLIKEKEGENPLYAFLFHKCLEQDYYKWKVVSNLVDKPPNTIQYGIGNVVYQAPSVLEEQAVEAQVQGKKFKKSPGSLLLSDPERNEFEETLRQLTTERQSILDAMVFCMDHSKSSADIVATLTASFSQGSLQQKLARLYLVSDLLHNSQLTSQQGSFWSFHLYFGYCLPKIFVNLNDAFKYQQKRKPQEANQFKEKVSKVLQIWTDRNIYEFKYLIGLESTFNRQVEVIQCDLSLETGQQLRLYEQKWMEKDKDTLQRACRKKGLPNEGTQQHLVNTLVVAKDYKLKKMKQIDKDIKGKSIYDVDGLDLSQQDLKMIEEHKVQVISFHDITSLFKEKKEGQIKKDEVNFCEQLQIAEYKLQLKKTKAYSSEQIDELCRIKLQHIRAQQQQQFQQYSQQQHQHQHQRQHRGRSRSSSRSSSASSRQRKRKISKRNRSRSSSRRRQQKSNNQRKK